MELSSLFDGQRPVVLAFVYHTCPMLCSLVLDGVADAVAETEGVRLGADYQVLAVSVDPNDTPARADSVKARYARLGTMGDPGSSPGAGSRRLPAVDVWPTATTTTSRRSPTRWASSTPTTSGTGEYAHNAAVIVLSPEGKVTRYLYGIGHDPFNVRLAVVEAGEGTVGSSLDKFLVTCFEYDHDAQAYSLAILGWTKAGGVLLLAAFGGMLVYFWRREARNTPDSWDDVHPTPAA